ncbi:MAG: hypothetical protein AB9842_11165 [Bacteroidales bacterium]
MLLTIPSLLGIRLEFIIFGMILLGVALFHKRTMEIALAGLLVLIFFKFIFDDSFSIYHHFMGDQSFIQQILHKDEREGEWFILLNLFGLLLGFAILARLFELSKVPEKLPAILPDDWTGGLGLLLLVFVMSSFLDNIAAAMIGGTIAAVVYKGKVHIGYLAAIVAASNAGGAGSVVGDTTTTLMWIDGVSPLDVIHAYVASFSALVVFGVIGSLQQDKFHRIRKDPPKRLKINYTHLLLVVLILVMAILTNVFLDFPALGVWIVITLSSVFVTMPWNEIPKAMKGSVFLLSLVTAASMMPVNELPDASIKSAFILGFVSSIFDNIPLTKLCLDQGGYDWGVLAYAVGFGGSMIWFGSSAGVALSNLYPEIRNTGNYLKKGWHVAVAYIIGFFIMLASVGWEPHEPHREMKKKPSETPVINEFQYKSK